MSDDIPTNDPRDAIQLRDRERLNAIARACRHVAYAGRPLAIETAAHLLAIFTLCFLDGAVASQAASALLLAAAGAWGALAWRRLTWLHRSTETDRRRIAVIARGIRDPRAAGRLLDLSATAPEPERQTVLAAAARLVQQMDDETMGALTPEQLDALRGELIPTAPDLALGAGPDERRITVAILQLMAERGHQPARREALRLSQAWTAPEVCDAARACLDRLDELAAAARLGETLLRPSASAAVDELLRPAEPAREDQLLRPAPEDEP